MKRDLIYPMALYAFYLFGLAVAMFRARVQVIRSGEVSMKYFRDYTGNPPAGRALILAQHFDNQFQVPMLFFSTCAVFLAIGEANRVTLILAWAFVFTRALHAWIHLGSNNIRHRALFFGLGWLSILLLWTQLVYFAAIGSS